MKEIARLTILLLAILLLIGCRTTKKHVTEKIESSELMECENRDSSYMWRLIETLRNWDVSIDNMELEYLPLPLCADTIPSGTASRRPSASPSSVPVKVRINGLNMSGQEIQETHAVQEHVQASAAKVEGNKTSDTSDILEKKPSSRGWATGTILMLFAFSVILIFIIVKILTNHGRKDTL